MPSEDVERLRAAFDRWNTGDRDFVDTVHPDVELHTPLASTRGAPYRGHDGFQQWMSDIDEQFEAWELRPTEFRELPDGRILAVGEIHLRGRESGIEIDQPIAWLFELRDGLVYRYTVWTDQGEALRSLGLG